MPGRTGRRPRAVPPTDPVASAKSAGLRYVTDRSPGITRKRSGKGFRYLNADGSAVRDAATLARIRSLAIPPAYTDVWICPRADGHIQATGRDARGRKQYRYHPRWREVRDETKYTRLLAFAEALPAIREGVDRDLRRKSLSREKVLAAVLRLLEDTCIRVGNDEYARTNLSFGLTTLRDEHVEIDGPELRFSFRGKSGKAHEVGIRDRRLARIVQHCQDLPGEELFQYVNEAGEQQILGSGDVNDYVRALTGQDFTAKDFRTWAGTVLATGALLELGPAETAKDAKANVIAAVDRVAARLHNTRAVCRKYYIHPAVLDAYLAGRLPEALANGGNRGPGGRFALDGEEAAVVRLLRRAAKAAA